MTVRARAADAWVDCAETVAAWVAQGFPDLEPDAFGFRPAVPDGWTLIEDDASLSVPAGANNRYYRNCQGGFYLSANQSYTNLIFVDCDFKGGTCGTSGPGSGQHKGLEFYGCRFGGVVTTDDNGHDAIQIKPSTSGGTRPEDWLFQGCTFEDVTRSVGASGHTDGIQFGGVLGSVIRYCYFENVAVEMILCNGFNGNPENVLIDRCYFGSRPSAGGPPIHFSDAGAFQATNCDAVDCYYSDGASAVASVEAGTSGCSHTGTQALANWPYGYVWETY